MKQNILTVGTVQEYTPEVAAGIGRLMPELSENFTADPVSEDRLRRIIASPDKEQLIARIGGTIVGAANLNTLETSTDTKTYLDNLVTARNYRGYGIGSALLEHFIELSIEKGASQIAFTSNKDRVSAHQLYRKYGAVEKDTTSFRLSLS